MLLSSLHRLGRLNGVTMAAFPVYILSLRRATRADLAADARAMTGACPPRRAGAQRLPLSVEVYTALVDGAYYRVYSTRAACGRCSRRSGGTKLVPPRRDNRLVIARLVRHVPADVLEAGALQHGAHLGALERP